MWTPVQPVEMRAPGSSRSSRSFSVRIFRRSSRSARPFSLRHPAEDRARRSVRALRRRAVARRYGAAHRSHSVPVEIARRASAGCVPRLTSRWPGVQARPSDDAGGVRYRDRRPRRCSARWLRSCTTLSGIRCRTSSAGRAMRASSPWSSSSRGDREEIQRASSCTASMWLGGAYVGVVCGASVGSDTCCRATTWRCHG